MTNNLNKTKKKKYFKNRSLKKGGFPSTPYTQNELNEGYVEGTSNNHCTFITSPTGTYAHATYVDEGTGFRYHYGFQRRANIFEGPKFWSNPDGAALHSDTINILLNRWENCRNQ